MKADTIRYEKQHKHLPLVEKIEAMKGARCPHIQSCWKAPAHGKEQFPSTKHPKNQGILTCKLPGREAPFKPAYRPQFLPPSDLAMEKGKKERKEMAGNGSLPLKQLRERGLELLKISDFVQIGRGNFTKIGKVKGGDEKGREKLGQNA